MGWVCRVHTSGFRKDVGIQYPDVGYIKKMHELDIPIVLGSDAHAPEEVAWEFKRTIEILKDIGYTQLTHFKQRKREYIVL